MSGSARNILLYFVVICTVVALSLSARPQISATPERLLAGLIFAAIAAVLVWLRWDWAVQRRRDRG